MDSKLMMTMTTKSETILTSTHLGGRVKSWIETATNGMTNEFVELSEGDAGVEIKLKKLSQGKAWDHGQKTKAKRNDKNRILGLCCYSSDSNGFRRTNIGMGYKARSKEIFNQTARL